MHFLGFYNIVAALAVVGSCCVSDKATAHDYDAYDGDGSYYAVNQGGGAEYLPPSRAIIDRPPTQIDGGYNPTYYWNRGYEPGPMAMVPPPYYGAPVYGAYGYHHRHGHHWHRWHVAARPVWETQTPALASWNTDWYAVRHGAYPQP